MIVFSSYLQDILSFGCSPTTHLNALVNLFEEEVVGSHTSLLKVEMAVLGDKCYGTLISKTEIIL